MTLDFFVKYNTMPSEDI